LKKENLAQQLNFKNMLEKLNSYFEVGLVYKQIHPTLPLIIWNYSEKVQYENLWDDITLQTRGLVTDDKGKVIARPFKKFFNIEEKKHTPTSEFDVYEKMDGSLGILFNYKNQWVFATRGSFTSDQAIKGKKILEQYAYQWLRIDCTYLFEIIYPENRIVVDYGDDEFLTLLGIIHTDTGKELNIYEEVYGYNIPVVKKYDGIKDYTQLKSMIDDNREGFVVRFSNGDRMKIKGEEYLRLHKIMTNISTTSVWEYLKDGKDIDELLKDVPDEFYDKIKSYVRDLRYGFFQISERAGKLHDGFRYGKYNDKDPEPTKKEFAEFVFKQEKVLHPVMFAMWDKKNYREIIWRIIRPEFRKL
jgi:RNA ligase